MRAPGNDNDSPIRELSMVKSSGNVFADVGLPSASEDLAKAELAFAIRKRILEWDLDPIAAAELLNATTDEVTKLLNGRVREFTLDRLLRCVNVVGMDVRMALAPTADRERGTTRVVQLTA